MNRRNFLGGMALLALLPGAALAQAGLQNVQIEPIYVARKNGQINVRVTLHNPGPILHTHYDVRLLARANQGEDWQTLQTFHERYMPSGKLVRDYIPVPPISPALSGSSFQVRAEVLQHGVVIRSLEQNWPA
ncbi:MAG: hypothetical protein ACYCW6_07230 [Candidatus Xenobia bacterium]